ncbi:MAG: tRNA (N6-threonylcarbamoyladenosine(37)-N6)-methyltransferase TrmO [Candidatus Micrarchaeota archaeon]
MRIELKPIGFVKTPFTRPEQMLAACEKGLSTPTISTIEILPEYAEGLKGLEGFSHAFVIYFLHEAHKVELTTHPGPPTVQDLPRVGVFASRSQYRPNHLALRLVKLVKISDCEVTVQGLDAINGTPVIDLKPYVAGFDRPREHKQAPWYDWLEAAQE